MHGNELRLFLGHGIPLTLTIFFPASETVAVGTIFNVFSIAEIRTYRLRTNVHPKYVQSNGRKWNLHILG